MSNATMFCRRHLQPATKKPSSASKSPLECLCLVTSRDDVGEILSSALQHVQIRWLLEPNAVPPLLLSLLKQEAPKPSGHIALAMSGNGVEEKFMFHRPAFDHMSVPCNVLYEYLSVDNCIAVMSAMLLEQRVIMCSSSLTALSSCVNAARSLLFPFKWKHSFYPVLPNSLLHHVRARRASSSSTDLLCRRCRLSRSSSVSSRATSRNCCNYHCRQRLSFAWTTTSSFSSVAL